MKKLFSRNVRPPSNDKLPQTTYEPGYGYLDFLIDIRYARLRLKLPVLEISCYIIRR